MKMNDCILALDLGTTHWKAALFYLDGRLAALERMPAPEVTAGGPPCYDPVALPAQLKALISRLDGEKRKGVCAVALTGMAEAGGLVRKRDHRPLTEIRPWFDRRSLPVFEAWKNAPAFADRQAKNGLPPSYKYGVFKLLAFREEGLPIEECLLLGVVEQACLALTGIAAADPTLASRTGAFDLRSRDWDHAFLAALRLPEETFPAVFPSGSAAGCVADPAWGLPLGIPVCICGHDHICAAYGAGTLENGEVLLSMGTAQVMITSAKELSPQAVETGLSFGPAPAGEGYTCLGSIQSAGASLNFWKKLLFPGEDYAQMAEAAARSSLPTGLVWLPYLSGSGAPHIDPLARASLSGMSSQTDRDDILAAVYEGIAMESKFVLDSMGGARHLTCLGGLTRHALLLRILASVTGAELCLPRQDEGTLYGAARLVARTALRRGDFPPLPPGGTVFPDAELSPRYAEKYGKEYLPMMRAVLSR